MFSRRLTRSIAIGATAIAIGGGAYGIVSATASTRLGHRDSSRARPQPRQANAFRRRGIQRSVWTGRRGSIRHGRQRVHVGLHAYRHQRVRR